uniref:(California timema) hypothetical protein n=1 Tax=Timema californicum TaxID=61474 RepID=A0A7R9P5S7_TIMCA|nr:unnamed protein product [Timema californicum]
MLCSVLRRGRHGFTKHLIEAPNFKRCSKTDPNFDECVRDAAEDAVHQLKNGKNRMTLLTDPNLGVFPLDPLEITSLGISQGQGPVSISLRFDNVKLHGISEVKVTSHKTWAPPLKWEIYFPTRNGRNPIPIYTGKSGDLKVTSVKGREVDPVTTLNRSDLDNYVMNTDVLNPKLELLSDYEISGRILLLPITGKGKCNVTLSELKSHIYQKGEPVFKNGKMYLNDSIFEFKMQELGRMYLDLENLFNGDKALGDNMNAFLNENWWELFKELRPALDEALSQVFHNIANRFFLKVPYDIIFPKEL